MIDMILMLIAVVLLVLAAVNVPSSRIGLFPLGMAFMAGSFFVRML